MWIDVGKLIRERVPDKNGKTAAQALADLGDTRGIAELERAVGGEQEQAVRSRLEDDLKTLRKKGRQ